jgi:outer membrane protein assembly factor BamB
VLAAVVLCAAGSPSATASAEDDLARQLLGASGIEGGVIVHAGCGDAKLTEALQAGDQYMVHGLCTDADTIASARERLIETGRYGTLSLDTWDGRRLPYIDGFVNLLVAEDFGQLAYGEIARVLCPEGVCLSRDQRDLPAQCGLVAVNLAGLPQGWRAVRKPRPEEIDEWTHFLHDATNNAVANDDVVAPPRGMQWVVGPRYSRHHDRMSSFSAAVSSGGRVFYIIDEAPDVSILIPPQWRLVARDAFNGTLLWKKRVGPWFSHLHGLKSGPADLPRKLVAKGDTVYVTLGIGEPVTALNAATGQVEHTFEGTDNAQEFVLREGVLYVHVRDWLPTSMRDKPPAKAQRHGRADNTKADEAEQKKWLLAIDAESGKQLWSSSQPLHTGTLAADERQVVFLSDKRIVALDRASGKELWRSEEVPLADAYPVRFNPSLVLYKDVVLFAGGEYAAKGNLSWDVNKDDTLTALSAATGKVLWTAPHPLSGYGSSEDLLVVNDLVWCGETTSGHAVGRFVGRDIHTGEAVTEFDPNVDTYWFHHRCYRGKATENYLMMSRTGVEFIDVEDHDWSINHWVRGACLYGVMPANGMLYAPQHPCACYLEAKVIGFNALAPEPAQTSGALPAESPKRLIKGPAYDDGPSDSARAAADDWPTYRHDVARTGRASTELPSELQPAWETELGGELSAATVAAGALFIASVDAHTVHALDAASGNARWHYTVGGRVDSPPTYWRGRVYFGSADGWVYCLRADDGALAWKFLAAPVDRRHTSFDQLESVWPVHGSVLIHDDVLYFVAGRSMFLDGGIRLYRLDPADGRVLSVTAMDREDPAGDGTIQKYARQQNMPVALADILSFNDGRVYMRSQAFEPDGTRLPPEALPYAGNPERYSIPPTQQLEHTHLFSPTGFLDDSYWHRTYWVYGSRFLGGWAGYSQAGRVTPSAKIMAVGESNVFGFGREPRYYRWTTPIEHQLFSAVKPEVRAASGAQGKKKGRGSVIRNWTTRLPMFVRAMVLVDGTLFVAGPPDLVDEPKAMKRLADPKMQALLERQRAAYLGAEGGLLWAVSADTGEKLSAAKLDTIPIFDGMAAAGGRLFLITIDGRVRALSAR